ncbi:hypothetical protein [Helicobacter sp. T3_23-1056]
MPRFFGIYPPPSPLRNGRGNTRHCEQNTRLAWQSITLQVLLPMTKPILFPTYF